MFDPDVATVNPVVIICDVTTGPDLGCGPGFYSAAFRAYGAECIPVDASEDELALAVPEAYNGEAAAAAALAALGVGQVIIKRGADGATGWSDGQPHHVAAHQVVVRDTVGAGDAFTAGYLSGLLDGLDVPARLERGATLGAFAVGYPGDWEALPTRAELRLREQQSGTTVR